MQSTSPRLRWILLLSLLLNVVLLAAMATQWWRHGDGSRGPRFGGVVRMPQLALLERALPATDHPVLRALYARHRPAIAARFQSMRDAKRAVRAALVAEPLDRTALQSALADMRRAEQDVAAAAHALLTDVAAEVSPAGRQALAKVVSSRRMWRGPPRRDTRNPD